MILREGQPARNQLDGIEEKIDELNAQIKATEDALVPHAETRERLRQALQAMYVPAHIFREFQGASTRYARLPTDAKEPALSIIVHLFGVDEVLDRIMQPIETGTEPVGLPAAERTAKVAELKTQLVKAEREAEHEALRLEGEGHTVLRRADADPHILLEIWGGMANESTAAAVRESPVEDTPRSRLSKIARELNSGAGPSATSGVDDVAAAIDGELGLGN